MSVDTDDNSLDWERLTEGADSQRVIYLALVEFGDWAQPKRIAEIVGDRVGDAYVRRAVLTMTKKGLLDSDGEGNYRARKTKRIPTTHHANAIQDSPHSKSTYDTIVGKDDTESRGNAVHNLESLVVNVINWERMNDLIALGGDSAFTHTFDEARDGQIFEIKVTVEVNKKKPPTKKTTAPDSEESRA